MKSQVQVLAGPPPSSQVTALPAPSRARSPPAWAALGPHTHPRRHLQWPRRGRPPGRQPRRRPPTVVAPPGEDASHAAAAATARCRLAPVPTAQPPATGAPHAGLACLVAQSASAAAAARTPTRTPTRRPGPPATSPDQRDLGSVARVPASATVDRAVDGPAATGPPPVLVVTVARSARPGSQRHRLSMGGRTRPDGRGRQQTAGHRTGGQQTADRRTRWTTTPGDRTPDSRIPDAEPAWVDTAWVDTGDRRRGLPAAWSTTATTPTAR
jgi:hypothetical protein